MSLCCHKLHWQGMRKWRIRGILQFAVLALLMLIPLGSTSAASKGASDQNVLVLRSGEFSVPPTGESFWCSYTDVITDRELSVASVIGHRGSGGHHVSLGYIDTPHAVGHYPCTGMEMDGWHVVLAVTLKDDGGRGSFQLPDGVAMKVPAGKQLVLHSHHINLTGTTMTAHDTVEVHLVDPSTVQVYVNMLFIPDQGLEVPPHGRAQRAQTCVLSRNIRVVALRGQMRQFGKLYRLEIVNGAGQPLTTLYEEAWSLSYTWNPPIRRYSIEAPLELAAGTRLRQTCDWDNPTDSPLRFPRETCITMLTHFATDGLVLCKVE